MTAPRVRLTTRVVADVAQRLSGRDQAIVSAVADLRYVTTVQLERLFFVDGPSASNARRARLVLRRLADLQVLHRLERRIGGVRAGSAGVVHTLGPVGQHLAGRSVGGRRRRPGEPSSPFVRHILAIGELRVRLTEHARAGRFDLVEFQTEPMCWRSFFGPSGARVTLKPDAFVRIGVGREELLWFVEVDCSTESTTALETKFRVYRHYWASGKEQQRWGDVFPKVLWLAPTLPRVRTIIDVAGRQPAESWKLFSVRPYEDALAALSEVAA